MEVNLQVVLNYTFTEKEYKEYKEWVSVYLSKHYPNIPPDTQFTLYLLRQIVEPRIDKIIMQIEGQNDVILGEKRAKIEQE